MADRILVPYDGSPQATEALELAFEKFPDATVIALYVIEVPDSRWAQIAGPELQIPVTDETGVDRFRSPSTKATHPLKLRL